MNEVCASSPITLETAATLGMSRAESVTCHYYPSAAVAHALPRDFRATVRRSRYDGQSAESLIREVELPHLVYVTGLLR